MVGLWGGGVVVVGLRFLSRFTSTATLSTTEQVEERFSKVTHKIVEDWVRISLVSDSGQQMGLSVLRLDQCHG